MTMDQKSKNIDCYFYYYSECVRGNFCKFRHEPSALGCEDVCLKWKDGNCTEAHCSLRHMELKKKRKEIPCYWEKQPGGCRKAHCAFKHQAKGTSASSDSPNSPEVPKNDSETSTQDWRNVKVEGASSLESTVDTPAAETSRRMSQGGPESYSSSPAAVEPIVVNFEEESDSESAPSWTTTKVPKEKDSLHVKTLEEIRLEKIQAESAAYWEGIAGGPMAWEAANPAANPSASPCSTIPGSRKPCNSSSTASIRKSGLHLKNVTKELDFRILTLDEIRKNRARKTNASDEHSKGALHLDSTVLSNGHVTDPSRPLLGMTDLRTKLSDSRNYDVLETVSLGDTWSSKRQRQETSVASGPSKKQRTIRLRRIGNLTGERTTVTTIDEIELCEHSNIDGHLIGDIDKLLME